MSTSSEFIVSHEGLSYHLEIGGGFVFLEDGYKDTVAIPTSVFRALIDVAGFGRIDVINDLTADLDGVYAKHEQD